MLPFSEYAPDISNYNQTGLTQLAQNVIPRNDGYGPHKAFSVVTQALAATCRGMFRAINTDGTSTIFAGTSTKLYRLNTSTLAWTDASLGSGTYTALPSLYHWQFAQFGTFVIAVQPNAVPQVFDLSSSTNFANLAGTPPQAAYVATVGQFLVLSGLTSLPRRVQWSGLEDVTNWTPGTNLSDFQDLPDGGVVRGVAGGEAGVIFQDSVIRRMVFQIGASYVFDIQRITEDKGLIAPYSIIRAGSNVFFLAQQGFHVVPNGAGVPQPIGKEKFDRFFFGDYDSSNPQLLIGAADPESTKIYWAYKSTSGNAGLWDKALIYDYGLNRASLLVGQTGEYIATLAVTAGSLGSLDSLDTMFPSIDAMTTSLDALGATGVANLPKLAMFDATHKLGQFSGANLEATLDTAEQALDDRRVRVQGFHPVCDASSLFIRVGTRERMFDTVTLTTEQALNANDLCPANVATRFARARMRVPAATNWTFATGVEPLFRPEGHR